MPLEKTLAIFLQDEVCKFAVIFMDIYFPDTSLKCHYFAEATTALLNGSIKTGSILGPLQLSETNPSNNKLSPLSE